MADELAELKAEVKRLHAKIQKVEGEVDRNAVLSPVQVRSR